MRIGEHYLLIYLIFTVRYLSIKVAAIRLAAASWSSRQYLLPYNRCHRRCTILRLTISDVFRSTECACQFQFITILRYDTLHTVVGTRKYHFCRRLAPRAHGGARFQSIHFDRVTVYVIYYYVATSLRRYGPLLIARFWVPNLNFWRLLIFELITLTDSVSSRRITLKIEINKCSV